jgi:ABC-type multidrug transport system fused ATPase/permease subunit
MNMMSAYFRLLRACRGLSIAAIVLAGVAAVAEGIALVALIPILDVFSGRASPALDMVFSRLGWQPQGEVLLAACLGAFVLLALLASGTRAASEILALWVKTKVETSMRLEMTDALLNMEWSHYVKLRQGDISKAMVLEGMQVGTGAMFMVSAAGALLAALCYLLVSFTVAVDLTLMALAFGVMGGCIYLFASRNVRKHADQLSQMVGDIGEKSSELFGNLKYFRATGQEHELRSRSSRLFDSYGLTYLKSQVFTPALRGGIELLAAVFIAGFLFYHLGYRKGSIAEILVFLAVFYRMVPRILSAQSYLFQARTYLTWHDTYHARVQLAQSHRLPDGGSLAPHFEHQLVFENVSFTYPNESRAVLNDVSLAIRKGECVALVGPSGGGKTTMTDLLTGLLRPSAGAVTVDSVDLNTLDAVAWRRQIGLVMQEPLILHASVAANVAMNETVVDPQRLQDALQHADAWEFVSRLPEGADTVVAEKGARLSGGQRQRISIARALYRSPQLLVLDEATSALDSHAEERIQSVIDDMKGSTTLVIVAHRLKTVKMADKIVVIEGGIIAESGTWDELMARQGVFHQMAQMQGLL